MTFSSAWLFLLVSSCSISIGAESLKHHFPSLADLALSTCLRFLPRIPPTAPRIVALPFLLVAPFSLHLLSQSSGSHSRLSRLRRTVGKGGVSSRPPRSGEGSSIAIPRNNQRSAGTEQPSTQAHWARGAVFPHLGYPPVCYLVSRVLC